MKKTLLTNVAMNDPYVWHVTVLEPYSLVSYRPFTAVLVWSVFLILPKCLFVIMVIYAYFIYISRGSVESHLQCGEVLSLIHISEPTRPY